ncbi:MAG: hypothetical protein WBA74_09185, partial [Cyclobacteriaceae bacterium]
FGNTTPVYMPFNAWHYLDKDSDYSGNSNDYIDTWRSGTDIIAEVTWKAISVPYRIPNAVDQISQGGVTIEAGTELISRANGGLEVFGDGYLRIEGTAANPITLRGEQDVQGYWRGLNFSSVNANNLISNATISNGGSSGFDGANRKANVEIEGSGLLTMTDVAVTQSGGYGIRVSSGGTLTSSGLTFANNVLSGNLLGGGVRKD